MADKVAIRGPGCFQWNAGAWFGVLFGGTAWLLAGAVVLAPLAPAVAGVWAACFVVVTALGLWLWQQRDRMPPYSLAAPCPARS